MEARLFVFVVSEEIAFSTFPVSVSVSGSGSGSGSVSGKAICAENEGKIIFAFVCGKLFAAKKKKSWKNEVC